MGKFSEMTYEERMAEAQRMHDAGDTRPVTQIEQETLAQELAGQPVTEPLGRDDSQLGAAARGDGAAGDQALRDHAVRDEQAREGTGQNANVQARRDKETAKDSTSKSKTDGK